MLDAPYVCGARLDECPGMSWDRSGIVAHCDATLYLDIAQRLSDEGAFPILLNHAVLKAVFGHPAAAAKCLKLLVEGELGSDDMIDSISLHVAGQAKLERRTGMYPAPSWLLDMLGQGTNVFCI